MNKDKEILGIDISKDVFNISKGHCQYKNGQPEKKVSYLDGILEGQAVRYHDNGQLAGEGNFKNGKFNGIVKSYFDNGQLKEIYFA